MIDAHIHLQDVTDQVREELFKVFYEQEFSSVFCNGTSPEDWDAVLAMAGAAKVVPFIGVHPWHVGALDEGWDERFVALIQAGGCGVGEIGLDRGPRGMSFARQQEVFIRQIEAASVLRRPFVLHCVKAWEPMLDVLRSYSFVGTPFIVHSFIGPLAVLGELLKMGAMISIGQRSLNQRDAREVIRNVPLDRLLLETDFPYLPGANTESVTAMDYIKAIERVYSGAAKLYGVSLETLAQAAEASAGKILRAVSA